jgi:FeS assembly SUF system protein
MQPIKRSLNVIDKNDKVEQLRAAFAGDAVSRPADASEAAADPVREKIVEAIRGVYDPEIPVNVYDLGLIYAIDIDPERRVHVTMTLTAPGCPVAGELLAAVERAAESVDEVKSAKVELVFEPQWTKERMSEAALLDLGLI